MEILVFSHVPSFPRNQGNRQRVFEITNYFKNLNATVHFAYFPREWNGRYVKEEIIDMQKNWDFVDIIAPSKKFRYEPTGDMYLIDEWWDSAIENYIKLKLTGVNFDICVVNYAFFSKLFEFIPSSTLKILDTHDRLSGRKDLLEKQGLKSDFFFTSREEENKALDRSDIILSISRDEANYFRENTSNTVIWMGHKYTTTTEKNFHQKKGKRAERNKLKLGFIGSKNQVNTKSIYDFVKFASNYWGEKNQSLEIIVAGNCAEILSEFNNCSWLNLLGVIDNIDEFYSNIDCIIIPLFFGTGQKIKTVEALTYEIPIFGAEHSFGGIKTNFKSHKINSLREFFEQIDFVIKRPETLKEMKTQTQKVLRDYNSTIENIEKTLKKHLLNTEYTFKINTRPKYSDENGILKKFVINKLLPFSLNAEQHDFEVPSKTSKKIFELCLEPEKDVIGNLKLKRIDNFSKTEIDIVDKKIGPAELFSSKLDSIDKEKKLKNLFFLLKDRISSDYLKQINDCIEKLWSNSGLPNRVFLFDNSLNIYLITDKKIEVLVPKNEILEKIENINRNIIQNSILISDFSKITNLPLIYKILYELSKNRINISHEKHIEKNNSIITNSFGELSIILLNIFLSNGNFQDLLGNFYFKNVETQTVNIKDFIDNTILKLNAIELTKLSSSLVEIEKQYFNQESRL